MGGLQDARPQGAAHPVDRVSVRRTLGDTFAQVVGSGACGWGSRGVDMHSTHPRTRCRIHSDPVREWGILLGQECKVVARADRSSNLKRHKASTKGSHNPSVLALCPVRRAPGRAGPHLTPRSQPNEKERCPVYSTPEGSCAVGSLYFVIAECSLAKTLAVAVVGTAARLVPESEAGSLTTVRPGRVPPCPATVRSPVAPSIVVLDAPFFDCAA